MTSDSQSPNQGVDFTITSLGQANYESVYPVAEGLFVSDDEKIAYYAKASDISALPDGVERPQFECAGPRKKLYFDPSHLTCGIVTCGGLCPGLNDVIRTITLTLRVQYKVKKVIGFRFGYNGLSKKPLHEPIELTGENVDSIQHLGGTMLGSSRGPVDKAEMVSTLQKHGIQLMFVIGGDGTFKGAHDLAGEIARQGLKIGVVGVPKTIDNDIIYTEKTFGLSTSIEQARMVLSSAHTEAKAAWNGVGLVKLMGRDSGFVAGGAVLANSDANFCLLPEVPFVLDGDNGFLRQLQRRLDRKHHAVVVVAEGAGRELMVCDESVRKDASGNLMMDDIGLFLRERIKDYFKAQNTPVSVKYFDPSYSIRSCAADADDSIFCLMLGQNAVHAGVAGKTDLFVGYWNRHFTHVPFGAAINKRKKIDLKSQLWATLSSTIM